MREICKLLPIIGLTLLVTIHHFQFTLHFFPNWRVFLDNKEVKPNYDNIYGYMDVTIPTGNHQIRFFFKNTPIRTIANSLTIISTIVCLSFIFPLGRKKLQKKSAIQQFNNVTRFAREARRAI